MSADDLESVCVVSATFESGPCCQITGAEEEEEATTGYFPCVVPPVAETAAQHRRNRAQPYFFFLLFCFEMAVNIFSKQLEKHSSARLDSAEQNNRKGLDFKRSPMICSSSANPEREGEDDVFFFNQNKHRSLKV